MKITDIKSLNSLGVETPKFDEDKMKQKTMEAPNWIHFGGGNIFRAFPAVMQQNLLNNGFSEKGIIVVEGFDYEIIEKVFRPNENKSLVVTLKANGEITHTLVGSIAESYTMKENDMQLLLRLVSNQSLQMFSFTITEKGYDINNDLVKRDVEQPIEKAKSYLGKIVYLLYNRFINGAFPIALVSMDNMSRNGEVLRDSLVTIAEKWKDNGFVSQDFVNYLEDEDIVSFPWSMIDKITPRPDSVIAKDLAKMGIENIRPITTSKLTYTAPFVNAEETEYLVIEDNFPNGRPPLEKSGVIFTDRKTVNQVETMKVTTCLNPLHTSLAVFGCLLGYDKIYEEMKDPDLIALVEGVGYVEGLPVVVDPKIIDPKEFIDEVINIRFINPFIPDSPQRIATDTSQKIGIRYMETIKSYLKQGKSVANLKYIPLSIAGWLRYLVGIDDLGNEFELSPDPLLSDLLEIIRDVKIGMNIDYSKVVRSILDIESIFKLDLYEFGLGDKINIYFHEMLMGPGAVRKTLNKYVGSD